MDHSVRADHVEKSVSEQIDDRDFLCRIGLWNNACHVYAKRKNHDEMTRVLSFCEQPNHAVSGRNENDGRVILLLVCENLPWNDADRRRAFRGQNDLVLNLWILLNATGVSSTRAPTGDAFAWRHLCARGRRGRRRCDPDDLARDGGLHLLRLLDLHADHDALPSCGAFVLAIPLDPNHRETHRHGDHDVRLLHGHRLRREPLHVRGAPACLQNGRRSHREKTRLGRGLRVQNQNVLVLAVPELHLMLRTTSLKPDMRWKKEILARLSPAKSMCKSCSAWGCRYGKSTVSNDEPPDRLAYRIRRRKTKPCH